MNSLVDSGCSARAFADRGFIRTNKIQTEKLPKERTLILADGKVADNITHYVILPVSMGNHIEPPCVFFITTLSPDTALIFSPPGSNVTTPQSTGRE